MAEECGNFGALPKPPFLISKSSVMDLIWASTTPRSKSARAPVKTSACLRDGVGEGVGGAFKLCALVAVGIGDREKNAAESRAAHLVFGREISATEKRLSVGKKKTGKRPAALAGNGANGGLVARIYVGALVAIDFHGHEVFIDDFGDFGVFVALAIDDVAPVAPDGADIEEDGFVFGFGAGESGVTPFVPVDGLVRSGAQVGAGGVFQAVFRMVGQSRSQF